MDLAFLVGPGIRSPETGLRHSQGLAVASGDRKAAHVSTNNSPGYCILETFCLIVVGPDTVASRSTLFECSGLPRTEQVRFAVFSN